MKTLTFKVTVEVSELNEYNIRVLERTIGNAIVSGVRYGDMLDVDEIAAEAKLIQVKD